MIFFPRLIATDTSFLSEWVHWISGQPLTSEMPRLWLGLSRIDLLCSSRLPSYDWSNLQNTSLHNLLSSIAEAIDSFLCLCSIDDGHNVQERSPTVQPDGGRNLCFRQSRCSKSTTKYPTGSNGARRHLNPSIYTRWTQLSLRSDRL